MRKRKEKPKDKFSFKMMFNRFTKIIVILTMLYSMGLTTVSYIWSYLGKDPLVNLSSTIISTLVAPVMTYLITNCIQCIFEKNQLVFSTPIEAIQAGITPYSGINTSTPISDEYASFSTEENNIGEFDSFEFMNCSGLGDDEE